jgi:DNA polymerase III subunit epsilon
MSRSPSRLDKRLQLAVLLLFGVPALAGAVLLLLAHRAGAFEGSNGTLVVAVLVGLAVTMGYVGLVSHGLGRSLVQTLHELRHGAELIATVNPEYRLPAGTGDEMESLARDINRLADQLRDARLGLEHGVGRATAELSGERAMLAAIVEDLDQAVVVVGTDGRVTLANSLAQSWLAGGTGLLGRTLYSFVERGTLAPSFERLQLEQAPPERVALTAQGGARLEARVTLFRRPEGAPAGFVLALRKSAAAPEEEATRSPEWTRFIGAGTTAGAAEERGRPHRPELYDFSFFDSARLALPTERWDQSLDRATFVVFDTETTGLEPDRGDRVVSLAGVKVQGGVVRRSKHFDAIVNPGRPIPPGSAVLHGITDARVAGMPALEAVMPAFLRFAEGAVLVGHEVWFDLSFLEPEAKRLGIPRIASSHPVLDTRLLSRLVHGELPEHDLEAVAERLGVTIQGRHSALGDAYATADVLVRLLGLLRSRGVNTMGTLLEAVGSLRRPFG